MKWRTFGDGNLARSPETQRIAALAVFESRQQVIKARSSKTPPKVQDVLDFFPNKKTQDAATTYALSMIPWARKQVEKILYDQRSQAKAKVGNIAGYFVSHNIEAIGDPAQDQYLMQRQQFDRETGGNGRGQVASQFMWRFGK